MTGFGVDPRALRAAADAAEQAAGVVRKLGYAPTRAEAAAFDELIPFYVLLRRLAAANWERQHGNPARTPRLLEQVARTRISP